MMVSYSIPSFSDLLVMRNLESGEIISVVGDQVVVKSASDAPKIGSKIYSVRAKVGRVSDVIGPVDDPYYVVKPDPNTNLRVGDVLNSR